MYLTVTCRPDIAYATVKLSQFNTKPTEEHWAAAKRILRYVRGTSDAKLRYRKTNKPIFGFSEANLGCQEDRKSFGGYIFMFAGCAVSWSCKKQQVVADSSTESEYIQLSESAKEAMFLTNIMSEFMEVNDPVCIFTDSETAIKVSEKPVITDKTKYIHRKNHFIRTAVKDGAVRLEHLSTSEMPADFPTKSLPRGKHSFCSKAIGIIGASI